jgi:hypothetical protein
MIAAASEVPWQPTRYPAAVLAAPGRQVLGLCSEDGKVAGRIGGRWKESKPQAVNNEHRTL